MNQYVLQAMTRAISIPLLRQKIYTLDMKPQNKKLNYVVGPSAITFYFELAKVNDIKKALTLQGPIQMSVSRAMNLSHGTSVNVRLYAQGGFLTVGVSRINRWLPTWRDVQDVRDNHYFIGFDEFNEPVHLDLFSKSSPGLLVIGESGSGKTNLMRVLANQLREKDVPYYLISLKGGRDWEHDLAQFAVEYSFDHEGAEVITKRVFEIMSARNKTRDEHEPLVFIFDEVTEADEDLQRLVGRIAKLCRSSNIRLVTGAQRAGEDLSKEVKGNLSRRVVGRVTPADSYNATNVKGSGAHLLEEKGDMLICHKYGLKRVQVPRADAEDLNLIVPEKKPKVPIVPLEPKAKKEVKPILKSDKEYLLSVLPLEKKKDLYKWLPFAIRVTNAALIEKSAKEIDVRMAMFSALAAFEQRKPATIKAVKLEIARLKIANIRTDRVRMIRYFGGCVAGHKSSLKAIAELWAVTPPPY